MRIETLTVYTPDINAQYQFYHQLLGFNLIEQTRNSITLKAGYSTISFEYKQSATPYHFAFNIPAYTEELALEWLKNKVNILLFEGREIADFVNWNAKSIYFYDHAKNIVELIARRNLPAEKIKEFNADAIMNISEIGMPVDDIESAYKLLNAKLSLPVYDSFNAFCAAGDEEGLFIIVERNRKKWFPVNDVAYASDFTITGSYNFTFEQGEVKLLVRELHLAEGRSEPSSE